MKCFYQGFFYTSSEDQKPLPFPTLSSHLNTVFHSTLRIPLSSFSPHLTSLQGLLIFHPFPHFILCFLKRQEHEHVERRWLDRSVNNEHRAIYASSWIFLFLSWVFFSDRIVLVLYIPIRVKCSESLSMYFHRPFAPWLWVFNLIILLLSLQYS